MFKKKKKKIIDRKISPKSVELIPWDTVCINLVPESARYSIILGCHVIQDLERLYLTMGRSLRKTSYISSGVKY